MDHCTLNRLISSLNRWNKPTYDHGRYDHFRKHPSILCPFAEKSPTPVLAAHRWQGILWRTFLFGRGTDPNNLTKMQLNTSGKTVMFCWKSQAIDGFVYLEHVNVLQNKGKELRKKTKGHLGSRYRGLIWNLNVLAILGRIPLQNHQFEYHLRWPLLRSL